MGSLSLLWAVHISDGVLSPAWWVGGFVLAGLLMLPGLLRVRDEEIPRIALLTAAFFVASLIHVKLGLTSVHLLLNGLVGVVLGWRAGLAIPVGLALQAALFGHGGFTTLGVNSCVMTLPALLAGWQFHALNRLPWLKHGWGRTLLVGLSVLAWVLGLVFGIALVASNRPTTWWAPDPTLALQVTGHPLTLAFAVVLAAAGAWAERRLGHAPEFAVGLLVGMTAVLATLTLHAVVLLCGGVEDWRGIVLLVFAAHLPVAVLEGIIMGFTVGFLARVKPELLHGWQSARELWGDSRGAGSEPAEPNTDVKASSPSVREPSLTPTSFRSPVLVLAVGLLLLSAAPARAHRLDAEYRILPDRRVKVESWYETDEVPQKAKVQVFREDGRLLTEGVLNEKGVFVFRVEAAEKLRVVVNAGAGHRKELTIPKEELGKVQGMKETPSPAAPAPEPRDEEPFAHRDSRLPVNAALVGIGFLLALAAFVLSLRNARELRALKQALANRPAGSAVPDDAAQAGATRTGGAALPGSTLFTESSQRR